MSVEAFPSTSRYYPEVTPSLPILSIRDQIERGQRAAALRRLITPVVEAPVETARQNISLIGSLGGRAVDAASIGTAEFGNSISATVFTLFNNGQEALESAPVRPISARTVQHVGEFALAA